MSQPRILVIEDNVADIELLRFVLDRQEKEYDLDVLKDGEEVLRFIEKHRAGVSASSPDPCVILLDIHLPKHDGLEILNALKREPALTHIQVIILSSVASPEAMVGIRSQGALYRAKPVSLQQYMELGAEILELCREPVLA